MNKDTGATLDDVLQQLKINNYLLAILLKPSDKAEADKIEHDLTLRLDAVGVPHVTIAELLGKTPHAIDNMLSRERNKGKQPQKTASDSESKKDA